MESSDKLVDAMLRDEMRRLNAHLPKSRRSLQELLGQDSPSVSTVDGGKIVMKKSELEELASDIPEYLIDRVKLPFVLFRRTELGPGAFTLLGDPAEEFVLSKVAKGFAGTYEDFRKDGHKQVLFYKPQVSDLMRKFHSLIVIGFGAPADRDK